MPNEIDQADWDRGAVLASLPSGCVVSVAGADAVAIVNNLTTNDIRKLEVHGVCESFVTDARGWVVAHGLVARMADEVWLIGQFPQPDSIVKHIDRYIVREDATPTSRATDLTVYLLDGASADAALESIFGGAIESAGRQTLTSVDLSGGSVLLLTVPVTSCSSRLAIVPSNLAGEFRDLLLSGGFVWSDRSDEIESRRIASFWPVAGREILEKTLPQELDRDYRTISFTKGCYLGQETVARLDARGQLQKKLCLLRLEGPLGDERDISREGNSVGRITSSAAPKSDGPALALAYLKRGNYDPGTQLQCGDLDVEVMEQPRLK